MLVVPPIEELDLVGPMEVLGTANRLLGPENAAYRIEVVTSGEGKTVDGECGLSLLAHGHYQEVNGECDSLLVICGVGSRALRNRALFSWMRSMACGVRRLGSVCVAAFLLAEAGLLDGKRATVHWKYAEELARRYPRVAVDPDPIWVQDGNIYTSAGISAGIDLALAWVEEDCGSAIALAVARELVLFVQRPASQTQWSVSLAAQGTEMRAIRELRVWIAENLHRKLSVGSLADRVAMSERNFVRAFKRESGITPSRYIARLRLEAACRHLERTDHGLSQIAEACGFGSTDLMRRVFLRLLATTPSRYRSRLNERG